MGLQVVNKLDIEKWKEFVESHPFGNVFHTPEMFEVFKRTVGYRPALWAVVDDDAQILALHTPVYVTLRGGLLHYLTTRAVDFGSILAQESELGKKALGKLLKKYNQSTAWASLFTELRNSSDLSYFQDVLKQRGYQYEPYLNYFLDLKRDEYEILQSFNRSTRGQIRSAIRKGKMAVKEIKTPEMLPIFYELIKKTYNHAKIPLADYSMFESAFHILSPKNMIRYTICFADGVPAAASVGLLYKDVIYGWYNGMDRSLRTYNPNEFIMWDEIKWGVENGYSVFDFGGAGKPDEDSGVRDFKLKFRGDLIEFGRNTCIHAPLRMKLAETSYSLGRKVMLSLEKFSPSLSAE